MALPAVSLELIIAFFFVVETLTSVPLKQSQRFLDCSRRKIWDEPMFLCFRLDVADFRGYLLKAIFVDLVLLL